MDNSQVDDIEDLEDQLTQTEDNKGDTEVMET